MCQHIKDINQYVDDVLDGTRLSNKWEILSCQRHVDDILAQNTEYFPYTFDEEKAARAIRFIELLPHIKGKWAGKPLILSPWQKFIVGSVFGWVHMLTGLRRFRTAYIEVPRKNAKSTLLSAIGLYMLSMDDEGGAEVYSAATTRDQARIVFRDAQSMARKCPKFRNSRGVEVLAHNINQQSTASRFEALSAEGNSLDGLNVHGGLVDELHAHKTRDVFDVLETATGAREQSILWLITTAGSNRAGICYEQRTYLTKLLEHVAKDETYFGMIYTIDVDDDWTNPDVWEKANPGYGESVFPEDIERLCRKAQTMPSAQNNFLTKRLNVWVNADESWMDMLKWEACGDPDLNEFDFVGEPVIEAIDLASKTDIAVKLKMFKRVVGEADHYYLFGTYYLPEETIINSGNAYYAGWEIEGLLTSTPGNVIDFDFIERDLADDASLFEVTEVPYDPFQATQFSVRMLAQGFPMIEVRPTVLNFSEPMKEIEALVLQGRLHHNGDPIMTWMISNVVCHLDAKDNIYPRKERVENKIDGVVAAIMALNRYLTQEQITQAYSERGVVSV